VHIAGGPCHRTVELLANPSIEPYGIVDGAVEAFWGMLNRDRAFHGGPPFLQRQRFVLTRVLGHSHGALIAVAARDRVDEAFGAFATSVRVSPPIDLHAGENAVELIGDGSADGPRPSLPRPEDVTVGGSVQLASLLRAMLDMDGIVLMSSDSYLHGYRCFVSAQQEGAGLGGARRLAFERLKLDGRFIGALYRSQDGAMEVFPSRPGRTAPG